MKILHNNKGVALVTSLMLTLISLALILTLLYIVTQNTVLSGSHRRYKTALEASYGGVEVFTKEIIPQIFKDYSSVNAFHIAKTGLTNNLSDISLNVTATDNCMMQKLINPSSRWTNCSEDQKSSSLASVKSAPDIIFNLQGVRDSAGYKVFTKIVDTVPGNTDTSAAAIVSTEDRTALDPGSGSGSGSGGMWSNSNDLISGAGAAYNQGGAGVVKVRHIPVRYRIEVQGERAVNPLEKGNLSVLYAY